MRLVFIHGMRQEGLILTDLRRAWRDSLYGKWEQLGLEHPDVEPEMPYYGDVLDKLTRELRGGGNVVGRGQLNYALSPTQESIVREFAAASGVTEAEVRAELGNEVVERGPANWEWVQAIGRILEERVPLFRAIGLSLVVQVDAYLNRPHVTEAVDEIVQPLLSPGPVVVVSHSLGTIIAYRLLRKADCCAVPLFVTLGSPLGINAVKDRIRPPKLVRPTQVERWINGADPRDFVALEAKFDERTFCSQIENIDDIQNRFEDAHSIIDYLADERIARAIHHAMTA